MAIWVPSVANRAKDPESTNGRNMSRGYSSLSPTEVKHVGSWKQTDADAIGLELSGIGISADPISEDVILEDLKVILSSDVKFFFTILLPI